MVERTQQQHRVDGGVGPGQRARLTEGDAGQTQPGSGLLDVQRHRINQVHLIPPCRQRLCVDTGAAAHVKDDCGRRR